MVSLLRRTKMKGHTRKYSSMLSSSASFLTRCSKTQSLWRELSDVRSSTRSGLSGYTATLFFFVFKTFEKRARDFKIRICVGGFRSRGAADGVEFIRAVLRLRGSVPLCFGFPPVSFFGFSLLVCVLIARAFFLEDLCCFYSMKFFPFQSTRAPSVFQRVFLPFFVAVRC
jgi:hypothetical protein